MRGCGTTRSARGCRRGGRWARPGSPGPSSGRRSSRPSRTASLMLRRAAAMESRELALSDGALASASWRRAARSAGPRSANSRLIRSATSRVRGPSCGRAWPGNRGATGRSPCRPVPCRGLPSRLARSPSESPDGHARRRRDGQQGPGLRRSRPGYASGQTPGGPPPRPGWRRPPDQADALGPGGIEHDRPGRGPGAWARRPPRGSRRRGVRRRAAGRAVGDNLVDASASRSTTDRHHAQGDVGLRHTRAASSRFPGSSAPPGGNGSQGPLLLDHAEAAGGRPGIGELAVAEPERVEDRLQPGGVLGGQRAAGGVVDGRQVGVDVTPSQGRQLGIDHLAIYRTRRGAERRQDHRRGAPEGASRCDREERRRGVDARRRGIVGGELQLGPRGPGCRGPSGRSGRGPPR